MPAKKDFTGAMNKMTGRDFVLPGERKGSSPKPFGEAIREELEREAEKLPITEISIDQLLDNPFQYLARPNLDEEAMQELVNSIEKNGFYGALLARPKKGSNQQYELAFGHRRKEAAKRAGLSTVPVKIMELGDKEMARIMASENFARQDLTPIGEANVVGHLSTTQNLSSAELAKFIGRGEGWVNLRLSLYNAPGDIKSLVETRPETLSYVRLLNSVKNTKERAELIEGILNGELTREKLEAQLKTSKKNKSTEKSNPVNTPINREENNRDNIVTDFTSSIQYQDSEFSNNQDVVYEGTPQHPITSNTPNLVNNRTKGNDYKAKLEEAIKRLDITLGDLETLLGEHNLSPSKKQEVTLVEIMERLSQLLSKGNSGRYEGF